MISRRAALKMSAAGLIMPALGSTIAPGISATEQNETAPTKNDLNRGPRLDAPIVVKWRFESLGPTYAAPTIAGGTVFLGKQGGFLYALDIATGQERWRAGISYEQPGRPVVADDLVIVTTLQRGGGMLQAFDMHSGTERWRLAPDAVFYTTPAVADSMLFVGAGDAGLYALDAQSGEERWRNPAVSPTWESTPAAANGIVYIGSSDQNLYAIDAASGQERWRFTTGDAVASEPVVADGVVYVSSEDQNLYAIDAASGIERWRVNVWSGIHATPAIADGVIYIGSKDPDLYALDAISGEERWRLTWGDLVSSISIADGIVYAGGYDNLLAIDATSGHEYWRIATGIDFHGGRFVTVADGGVYAVYEGANLVALGNLDLAVLGQDVVLRGAPGSSGIERGRAQAGDEVDNVGAREVRDGQEWTEVTIGDVTGWIPLDAIDPATLPPEGEIEYVYIPE